MEFVDIGANLTHEAFHEDRADVLARAVDSGVERLVITGADAASSRAALELAREHPQRLRATAGVHPHGADSAEANIRATLETLAGHRLVTAVGEAGLDFNRDFSPRAMQEQMFEQQLELAAKLGLPVFAHERDAHTRFLEILARWRPQLTGIVVHCFTGTREQLDAYLDHDCHIGITGWICDERRGADLIECIDRIPNDRLMIETDAPYLLPRDLTPKPRSRRNEPMHLPHIAARIAQARGESLDTLAEHTAATARRFFGF